MTTRRLLLISAALVGTVGCAAGEATVANSASLPARVECADAPTLRIQAAEARRQMAEQTGDRARIIRGNRANFLASLVVVAELKCRTDGAAVNELLEQALEIGRVAEATRSEYEAASRWTEADLVAAEAIALLVSQLPASPPR